MKNGEHYTLLTAWRPGIWKFQIGPTTPAPIQMVAGMTDRTADLDRLRAELSTARAFIQAEQVHGGSIAAILSTSSSTNPVPGCDGLTTQAPGIALVIRTADCLPIMLWDPIRRAVGVIHAGWRGLVRVLPMRAVSFMRQMYRSRPQDLWVGIGPAIHACCYDVGPEFEQRFKAFIRRPATGRRTCDLIACAIAQLATAGVPSSHVIDSGECTACPSSRWHSVRAHAQTPQRIWSWVALVPMT